MKHQLVHLRWANVAAATTIIGTLPPNAKVHFDFCPFCNQDEKLQLQERGSICEHHVTEYYALIVSMCIYFNRPIQIIIKQKPEMLQCLQVLCKQCSTELNFILNVEK